MKKFIALASMCLTTAALAEKWDGNNNPNYFSPVAKTSLKYGLSDLPLNGKLQDDRLGWSETYWPSYLGGIAFRWNHPNPQPFKYKFHSKKELLKMSEAELGQLSPAELYDIAQGDYSYTLTKRVLWTYKPNDLWWEGICHGWALAAANYPEPDKNVVTNKDGIRVPFGASDVKGLLAMHDAFNSKGFNVRVGNRCGKVGKVEGELRKEDGHVPPISLADANAPDCKDVNAGAFHVVLTNMVGINSQSFVADIDRYNDVWNQPVTGYETTLHEEVPLNSTDRNNGVARKVRVTTVMEYGDELMFAFEFVPGEDEGGIVSKEPVTGTKEQTFGKKIYEYVLELDRSDRIVGGEWISATRPDFIWMKKRDESFRDSWRFSLSGLNKIYRPVRR